MVAADIGLMRVRRRRVDWVAAAVAGFAAGAALMVLQLLWAVADGGDGPWRVSQQVAALLLGPQALHGSADRFDAVIVGCALLTHYALGVVFGLVLAAVMSALRALARPAHTLAAGAAGGALLYGLNFHLLTAAFPWMAELRSWEALFAHLLFGAVAAMLYRRLARTVDTR